MRPMGAVRLPRWVCLQGRVGTMTSSDGSSWGWTLGEISVEAFAMGWQIEQSKENVQPLAQGRDAAQLLARLQGMKEKPAENTTNIFSSACAEWEEKLAADKGSDPLALWDDYIKWAQQVAPPPAGASPLHTGTPLRRDPPGPGRAGRGAAGHRPAQTPRGARAASAHPASMTDSPAVRRMRRATRCRR